MRVCTLNTRGVGKGGRGRGWPATVESQTVGWVAGYVAGHPKNRDVRFRENIDGTTTMRNKESPKKKTENDVGGRDVATAVDPSKVPRGIWTMERRGCFENPPPPPPFALVTQTPGRCSA